MEDSLEGKHAREVANLKCEIQGRQEEDLTELMGNSPVEMDGFLYKAGLRGSETVEEDKKKRKWDGSEFKDGDEASPDKRMWRTATDNSLFAYIKIEDTDDSSPHIKIEDLEPERIPASATTPQISKESNRAPYLPIFSPSTSGATKLVKFGAPIISVPRYVPPRPPPPPPSGAPPRLTAPSSSTLIIERASSNNTVRKPGREVMKVPKSTKAEREESLAFMRKAWREQQALKEKGALEKAKGKAKGNSGASSRGLVDLPSSTEAGGRDADTGEGGTFRTASRPT
ncbi:hypothetical protein DL98DRAFT_587584 [Cadophora sp. DSE1049]|nr:hypothetical protein DL98DRAFT_587584 [Cadophora sp. DSE1049]